MRTLNHEQIKEVLLQLSKNSKQNNSPILACWNEITDKDWKKIYYMNDGLDALYQMENYHHYMKNSPRFNLTKRFMSIDVRRKKLHSAGSLFEFDGFSLDEMADYFKGMTITEMLDEFNGLAQIAPTEQQTLKQLNQSLSFNALYPTNKELWNLSKNIDSFIWDNKGLAAHNMIWMLHFYGSKSDLVHISKLENFPTLKEQFNLDHRDLDLFKKGDWIAVYGDYYDDYYATILDDDDLTGRISEAFKDVSSMTLLKEMMKAEERIFSTTKKSKANLTKSKNMR